MFYLVEAQVKLKSISVKGGSGVINLVPIDRENQNVRDMVLILFSEPKVKGEKLLKRLSKKRNKVGSFNPF